MPVFPRDRFIKLLVARVVRAERNLELIVERCKVAELALRSHQDRIRELESALHRSTSDVPNKWHIQLLHCMRRCIRRNGH